MQGRSGVRCGRVSGKAGEVGKVSVVTMKGHSNEPFPSEKISGYRLL